MKIASLITVVLSLACVNLYAADQMVTVRTADGQVKKMSRTEVREKIYKHFGEKLKVPGKQKGKAVIVDAASDTPAEALAEVSKQFDENVHIAVEVQKGAFDFAEPKLVGEATLFIVDDPKLPMSLVAQEARWAVVNVAKLRSEKPQFYRARVKKETVRILVALLGGCNSTFPDALTGYVGKAEDLDRFADTRLQAEIEQRFPEYMKKFGLEPYVLSNYRKACMEGWAPQPTNDVQKAIWDDVHAIPDAPMKIEFDPKKGR